MTLRRNPKQEFTPGDLAGATGGEQTTIKPGKPKDVPPMIPADDTGRKALQRERTRVNKRTERNPMHLAIAPLRAADSVGELSLLSLLLDVLGYGPDEFVSIAHKGRQSGDEFTTTVTVPSRVEAVLSDLSGEQCDVWFGVNPTSGPERVGAGRGKTEDITRLAALIADLDAKGDADAAACAAIVDELSDILGTRPSAVVESGNGGLHPYWPIADGEITDTPAMAAFVKRWGRLVKAVARRHGAAADSVFDLPRVMRAPGTTNWKHGGDGQPAVCRVDSGRPLSVAEVVARLDECGVIEEDGDRGAMEPLSDPNEWEPAEDTCNYVAAILDGIPDDGPVDGGRHQWLGSLAVRLGCAAMLGCITEADYQRAAELAHDRMVELRAATGEPVPPWEVPATFAWGIDRAATKTHDEARAELKNHQHLWPSPDAPRDVAVRVVAEAKREGRPWCYWNGMWFVWGGKHYETATPDSLRDWLYGLLGDAQYQGANGALRWKPNPRKLNEVIDAARGLVRLPEGVGASGWIDGRKEQVIPCANGLLRVTDRMLLEHTPEHFSIMSLPYSYDATAVCPRWMQFLGEVFGEDVESVALLQQWFGYVLSGRSDLQKMVMWLGPMRGGKGTVARLLKRLVGERAYAGVNVADLRNGFALQPLIDKSLVVFPDERQVGAPDGKKLVQFVLQATGEDDVTVSRKYKDAWSGRLPMRLMYFGKELPVLPDSSGAVQNRILTIETVASFAGREDRGLDGDLAAELPGILNWALDGLETLQECGEFVQPESGRAAAQDVDDFSNHVRRYLMSGRCRFADDARTECTQLWHDFEAWCLRNGIESNANAVWFGRQLRPAVRNLAPGIKFERKRNEAELDRPYYYTGIALLPQPNHSGAQQKWA